MIDRALYHHLHQYFPGRIDQHGLLVAHTPDLYSDTIHETRIVLRGDRLRLEYHVVHDNLNPPSRIITMVEQIQICDPNFLYEFIKIVNQIVNHY